MRDRGPNLLRGLRLVEEVELVLQRPPELAEHRVVVHRQLRSKCFRKRLQVANVPQQGRHHVGPLQLHRHHPPVQQRGFVHLGDGGAPQRLFFEFREQLAQRLPLQKLLPHNRLHQLKRHRVQRVLQGCELGGVRFWEQVDPGRDHLPRLHVEPFQLFDGLRHHGGPPLVDLRPLPRLLLVLAQLAPTFPAASQAEVELCLLHFVGREHRKDSAVERESSHHALRCRQRRRKLDARSV
mmetsp:Transcript_835/g.1746  ORF Transcript_835/g.1746 Transcript_835/m.1746 type:complete len:238 (-) Transcript_835:246-959(-)